MRRRNGRGSQRNETSLLSYQPHAAESSHSSKLLAGYGQSIGSISVRRPCSTWRLGGNACIEAHLPDDGRPFQTGLAVSPFCRQCSQAKAAAVRPELTRSRTARPDTQSVEVPWKVKEIKACYSAPKLHHQSSICHFASLASRQISSKPSRRLVTPNPRPSNRRLSRTSLRGTTSSALPRLARA